MQIRDLINATPHEITIWAQVTEEGRDGLGTDWEEITIPASGQVARVSVTQETAGEALISQFSSVPVFRQTLGLVTGLPRDDSGRILPCLVSGMVLEAVRAAWIAAEHPMRDRSAAPPPVFAPDTGASCVRDDGGRIVAVTQVLTI